MTTSSQPGPPTTGRRARPRWTLAGEGLAVLVTFAAIALGWSYPLILRPGSAVVWNGASDLTEKLWNLWWFRTALWQWHQSPFWTDWIYYPRGISLYLQPFNLPAAVAAIPLQSVLGLVGTYNLIVLASVALAGLACYLLARRRYGRAGALVAALIYTVNPFHADHLSTGTLEQITLYWLPLVALALLALIERPAPGRGVWLGLALAATGLASWYHLLYAGLLVAVLLGVSLLPAGKARPSQRPLGGGLLVAAATSLAVLAPLLAPTIGDLRAFPTVPPSTDAIVAWSVDLLALFTSGTSQRVGVIGLGLALLGLATSWRRALPWLVAAIVFYMLSLGPVLHVAGVAFPAVPMPYRVLEVLPLADASRFPYRFYVGTLLGVAMLAGLGCDRLLALLRRRRLVGVAGAGIVAAVALNLWPAPLPVRDLTPNPVYAVLATRPAAGAVVEYPLRDRLRSYQMYNATIHGRPTVGGWASRGSPFAFVDDGWLARALIYLSPELTEDVIGRENGARLFAAAGIRYLIFHRDIATADEGDRFARLLARSFPSLQPFYSDAELSAYELPDADGVPAIEPATRGEWYAPEQAPGQAPWRWTRGPAVFRLIAASPRQVVLQADLWSYGGPRAVEVQLNDRPVRTLAVDELSQKPPAVEVPLALAAGENWVSLVPSGAAVQPPGDSRALSLAVRNVRLSPGP